MVNLKRWWNELQNPRARCDRTGHAAARVRERQGYRSPDARDRWAYVAVRVSEERDVCPRCREALSGWVSVRAQRLTGLTLDGDKMDQLDRDGEVWMRQGWAD